MKTRGERLKSRRKELGLTLQAVASLVGMSIPGVQNLERGDSMPSLESGVALARVYKKSIEWVLFGSDSDPVGRVPVIGDTLSGPNIAWLDDDGFKPNEFLPIIGIAPKFYGLKVEQNFCSFFVQLGDFLIFDSATPATAGDDVIFIDQSSEVWIKRLAKVDSNSFYFEGIDNMRMRIIKKKSEISLIHPVVGSMKSNTSEVIMAS